MISAQKKAKIHKPTFDHISTVRIKSTRKSTVGNDFRIKKSEDPQSSLDRRSTDRGEPAKKSTVHKKSGS